MGQVLHGCATTTHAVRTAIQRSKAPLKELAARYGLNHKTVAKWRKRAFVNDAPMGPKHEGLAASRWYRCAATGRNSDAACRTSGRSDVEAVSDG